MFLVPQATNTLVPPANNEPLMYNPTALTHSLVVKPAAITTVQHIPAEPRAAVDEPIMTLSNPLTTLQPAQRPIKIF